MRRKGFSFACPCPVSSKKDVAFQRFLETAEVDPSKVHNPFPQIACSDNFNQAHTQPLVRISYLPISDLYILNIYQSELKQEVTDLHEWCHINFDITPAKMLARVISARAYACLNALLFGETWEEEIWEELAAMNARLSAICSAITLSEELIAIAESFGVMAESIHYSEKLVELKMLEKKSVKKYQCLSPNFPDFAILYYKTFKKVVGWCLENNVDDLWQYLGMFLQGIQLNSYKSDVEVVNSNRRCESLAEKTKDMKNGAELKDWIIRTAIQPTDEFEAYIATKSLLIDPRESSSKEGLLLWTLMYGRRPSKRVRDAVKVALNASFSKQHALKIDLYAQESDKGWFIVPSLPKFFFKGSRSQEEAAFQLLPLESLRQQLDEREGICCAYYRPDECICPLPWRKALSRILQWARENKFGTGKWRDLPPKCTSRN